MALAKSCCNIKLVCRLSASIRTTKRHNDDDDARARVHIQKSSSKRNTASRSQEMMAYNTTLLTNCNTINWTPVWGLASCFFSLLFLHIYNKYTIYIPFDISLFFFSSFHGNISSIIFKNNLLQKGTHACSPWLARINDVKIYSREISLLRITHNILASDACWKGRQEEVPSKRHPGAMMFCLVHLSLLLLPRKTKKNWQREG